MRFARGGNPAPRWRAAAAEATQADAGLTAAAAEPAPHPQPGPTWQQIAFLTGVPASVKDEVLLRLLRDDDPYALAELHRRVRRAHPPAAALASQRTAAQLRAAAPAHAAAQRERQRREQVRRAEEAREQQQLYHVEALGGPEAAWRRVDELVAGRARGYDHAVWTLQGLAALADQDGTACLCPPPAPCAPA